MPGTDTESQGQRYRLGQMVFWLFPYIRLSALFNATGNSFSVVVPILWDGLSHTMGGRRV